MFTPFTEINYLAVIVSAVIYFILGAAWYSPGVFGKDWQKLVNIKVEAGSSAKLYIASFVGIIIISIAMAYFIVITDSTNFSDGMRVGFISALAFMGMPLAITFLYEAKETKLFLIDAGYHFFGFLLMGTTLAIWR